jgi:predicted nucleic-acid-binding protein
MINISEELNKITNTDNYKYFALADIDNHFYVIGGFQDKIMAEIYCETSSALINGVEIKNIDKENIKIIDIIKFQNEDEELYKDTIKFIFQDLRYWSKPAIFVSYENLIETMREVEEGEKMSSDKYIKLVEAFECEGYNYSDASKLAYEALNDEPYISDEDKQQVLAEIAAEKQQKEKNE